MRSRAASVVTVIALACGAPDAERTVDAGMPETVACDGQAVRDVVARFGAQLKQVSLLAADSIVVRQVEQAYAPLVTTGLLAEWRRNPSRVPGRDVSSPWPERIDVVTMDADTGTTCTVAGEIVYMSSEPPDSAVARVPVTLRLVQEDAWRIASFSASRDSTAVTDTTGVPEAESPRAAARVIRRYYDAIGNHRYAQAYALWAGAGTASGQSLGEFTAGYAETASVTVEIGEPGRIGAAAGSRYVDVPVVVNARTRAGAAQRFEGTYTLRRSVVDGATDDQRSWRIYAADLRPGA